jgi:hypothetical protein
LSSAYWNSRKKREWRTCTCSLINTSNLSGLRRSGKGLAEVSTLIDVHRAVAYLTPYLAGEKIIHTPEHLPKRARIFTTSRSIVLWGKKKKSGGFLRRLDLGSLYSIGPQFENCAVSPPRFGSFPCRRWMDAPHRIANIVHDLSGSWNVSLETVPYEFQRGGNQMMRVRPLQIER